MSAPAPRTVVVPPERWARWVENFTGSHGPAGWTVADGALLGEAEDGSTVTAHLPFDATYDGDPAPDRLAAAARAAVPDDWGVLLVRRGGFAVARLAGTEVGATKVGKRHVQGRTAAGGQSQQRFARRRAGQARVAFEAAADHAVRLLGGLGPVVRGGDRGALDAVLADPRLARVRPVGTFLEVGEPRRAVLDGAVADALGLSVVVVNAQ
ncbi:acVLRF1 family peptidyl-tRNA hydrolase [uncultured Nocardioides sp.]|uniref:acVLRF1 family peptidyl-tRNA hydrolase n=1 Tax=uncultured Nocardioides sp. TaxID=198441 RepID=UPI002635BEAE|nr:acVLRF1 family peptidyl-tRNA hydrolase [uncultured Nocardioides sp.]